MIRFRDWPWAVKLAVVMVGLALLPIAIVTAFTEVTARRDFIRDSGSRNLQQTTNTAGLVARYLDDVLGDIRILARSPAAVEVLSGTIEMSPRLDALMRGIRDTKRLELLQVLAHDGKVVAATDPSRVGTSRVTAPFFISAMAGQSLVHEPRYVADDRDIHINASVPIVDPRDRVLGVAAVLVALDEIDRLIAADSNYGGLSEYGMLWNEQGIVISSPAHPERRLRPLAPLLPFTVRQLIAEDRFGPDTEKLLTAPLAGDAIVSRARWRLYDSSVSPHATTDLDDGRLHVTSVPVPGTRWTYAIATPEARALAVVRLQSGRNLALALATAILAVLISLVATRWVSRPLGRVGDAARALAAGDMSRRAGLHRRDEIGQLADTFDTMAEALAAKDAELREYADSLERRVDERTADVTGLLRAVPDLIFKVSADGRLVDYVPAKGEEIALPAEQFLGRPITDVLPHEVSPGTVERIQRALTGEEVAPYEYRLAVGGEERHYEARISPSSQGAVVVLVRDITERRRGEERTRFLSGAAASLSSSLDYGSTVETLANLAIPFLADLCIVDLTRARAHPLRRGRGDVAGSTGDGPDRAVEVSRRANQRTPGCPRAARRRDAVCRLLDRDVPLAHPIGRARVTGEWDRRPIDDRRSAQRARADTRGDDLRHGGTGAPIHAGGSGAGLRAGRSRGCRPRQRAALSRTAGVQPPEGRVPRHRVARAADAAERGPRLGAGAAANWVRRPGAGGPRARRDRAQREGTGAAGRGPPRYLARRQRKGSRQLHAGGRARDRPDCRRIVSAARQVAGHRVDRHYR